MYIELKVGKRPRLPQTDAHICTREQTGHLWMPRNAEPAGDETGPCPGSRRTEFTSVLKYPKYYVKPYKTTSSVGPSARLSERHTAQPSGESGAEHLSACLPATPGQPLRPVWASPARPRLPVTSMGAFPTPRAPALAGRSSGTKAVPPHLPPGPTSPASAARATLTTPQRVGEAAVEPAVELLVQRPEDQCA